MTDVFTLRVPGAPADLFATLFAVAFATLLTGFVLVSMGVTAPFVDPLALGVYAVLTALALAALWFAAE